MLTKCVNLFQDKTKYIWRLKKPDIEFVNRYENINFDEKMNKLRDEFTQLLQEKEQSKQELVKVFRELGFPLTPKIK